MGVTWYLNSVFGVKALVGAINQEKALVGAFYMIVKTSCGTDGALHSTSHHYPTLIRTKADTITE